MILHISNDFSGSTVYKNLISELDKLDLSQVVYNPIREINRIDKNKINLRTQNSQIIYSKILNNVTDRLFYGLKVRKIVKDIEKKVDLKTVKFIHAHTWYSDGGVAYELNKKYNIPYIITVRNTDLNLFFKYMFHLRTYASNILEHTEKIIFISPIYFNRLFSESYFKKMKKVLQSKSLIVPNGIDFFWSTNKVITRNFHIKEVFKLLYIGKFTKGKNVLRLVKAVEILNQKGIKIHLNLVGGDGSEFTKVMSYINGKSQFSYHGKIYKKEELKKIFLENDIFTMPSHTETFGLVYIEALSQGIPIVYTLNEGIYGFYDHTIGEAVDSYSVISIVSGIEKICNNYSRYNFNPEEIVDNHNWAEIAKKYLSIYRERIK